MDFDFSTLPPRDRYRLLSSLVAPRPVALVTTRSEAEHDNAAPISFFNVFGEDPPIIILGISARGNGSEKDTLRNIRRTGEFVANMVDLPMAQQMVVCAVEFDPEVDELAFAGLTTVASHRVRANRISESPCAMGCRVERIIDYPGRALVFGEVLEMFVRDECLDADGHYVDPAVYQPIARLHRDNYVVCDNQFELSKPVELLRYETWRTAEQAKSVGQ